MNLTADDLTRHQALGIPADLLAAAGVQRVTNEEARELFGIKASPSCALAGIVYPYRHVQTGDRVTCRLRRDHPEVDSDGKPIGKYLAPYGDKRYLYFAPGAGALLASANVPVVIVEAEKSVLALTASGARLNRPILPIGTGGCWGWRGRIGKVTDATGARVDEKGPLSDFDRVTWAQRDVVILFDANAATNDKVKGAQRALAADLKRRGASVRIGVLPLEVSVNGPDDFIGKHGDAAVWTVIDAATPATDRTPRPTSEKKKAEQGRAVELHDPEHWPEPVDGAALLDAMAATFQRYLSLPQHAATALALWALHTFALDAFFTTPFLALTSPVKRCGKTLLLIILGALVPRRLFASNVTPAVLFRTIEKYRPTLLIDEADTFIRDNDELRGLLNSGHTRTTAVTIRAVGDDHDPRVFSTWCAKAIAMIGKLPDTLGDRAIEVRMRRRTANETVQRLRQDRIESECAELQRQAARWAADHLAELKGADPSVPTLLHDRAADCWRPPLAVADAAGGDWPTRARVAASALSGANDDAEQSVNILLLADLRDIMRRDGRSLWPTQELLKQLRALDDRPWATWGKEGKGLTGHALAKLLGPFEVHSKSDGGARGYAPDRLRDAWARYLDPAPGEIEASKCQLANEYGPELAKTKRQDVPSIDTLKTEVSPMNTGPIDTLTLPIVETGPVSDYDDSDDFIV